MQKSLQKDFTQGNLAQHLFRFCVPFLLANLLQALYGMVDVMVVGNFCEKEVLAGVNSGSQVTHLMIMAVSGLSVGGTVLVAQYFAARRNQDVSETIGTMFSLLFICAVVISAGMLIFINPVLELLNLEGLALEAGADYLRICTYGNIFVFGYNAISAVQRGMGDSKHPLWFVGIACVVNIFLDLLLVAKFKMGAAGAAWATIIAQAVSLLLATAYLARNGFVFDFKLKSFAIKKDKTVQLVKLGLPSSVQSIITNLSFLVMNALSNGIGVAAGAAVGVVGKINSVAILPIVAMSSSVSAIAAQNIAADQQDRAMKVMKYGIGISLAIGAVVFAVSQLLPEPLIRIFNKEEDVIDMGVKYLRAFCFDYITVSFLFSMNALIGASGHATFTLITSSLSAIVLRAPVAMWLSKTELGIAGVGYAAPAATAAAVILSAIFIISGRWKHNTTGIHREA